MTEQTYYLSGFTNYCTGQDVENARKAIGVKPGLDAISVYTYEDGMIRISYLSKKPIQHGQGAWQGAVETK